MGWLKIDDHLHAHPKVLQAWRTDPAAVGLYLLALSYAGDYLTDGVVDDAFVHFAFPSARARDRATTALLDAGLWERNGEAWMIHDYLEYNESREQAAQRRRKDSERKRNGIR